MFSTTLSASISKTDIFIPLKNLPAPRTGYLVIDPDTEREETIHYVAHGPGFVKVATSPGDRTNGEGFGRGAEGTFGQDHDQGAIVRETPETSRGEITIEYADGTVFTFRPTIKLKQSPKLRIKH